MSVARLRNTMLAFVAVVAIDGHFACAQSPSEAKPDEAGESKVSSSPLGWLKMPTITMPKITMPKITMPKMPADPLAPFKTSAKKVGDGTKKAWEGAKELFTFGPAKGEEPAARVASKGESPSMMQRLFGGEKEQPEDEGPRTIGEWMAQPRVDP